MDVHLYYKYVIARKHRGCKKKSVRKPWLEVLVISETMAAINDDDTITAIVDAVMILQDQENTTLPLPEQQRKDTETAMENMINALQMRVFTVSTKERSEKLEKTQTGADRPDHA